MGKLREYNLTQTGPEVQADLDLTENIQTPFSVTQEYNIGDLVIYKSFIWRCHTPITEPGAWTGEQNWEQTDLSDIVTDYHDDTKVSKVSDNNIVYGRGEGNEWAIPFGWENTTGSWTIVQRGEGNQIKVPLTPTSNDDATSKSYVDENDQILSYNICAPYDNTKTYEVNDIAIYNNQLVRCTVAITEPEEFNVEHWTFSTIKDNFVTRNGDQRITGDNVLDGNVTFNSSTNFNASPNIKSDLNFVGTDNKTKITFNRDGNLYFKDGTAWSINTDDNNKKIRYTKSDGQLELRGGNLKLSASNSLTDGTNSVKISEISTKQHVEDSIASAISRVYRPKGGGTIAYLNDGLPKTASLNGDVYNMLDDGILNNSPIHEPRTTTVKAGDNIVFIWSDIDGTVDWYWDKLSADIDLSNFATIPYVDTGLEGKVDKSGGTMTGALGFQDAYHTYYIQASGSDSLLFKRDSSNILALFNNLVSVNTDLRIPNMGTNAKSATTKEYVDANFGNSIEMRVDSDYKIYLSLINKNGQQIGETQVIDLPLESVVVSGYYDSDTKEVVLTLKDGSTIRFSVADLVSGLQTEITPTNKLGADLVDDDNTTHKFVTESDKANWNGKQDALVSGTNIKTINNESILGSGNIDIQGGGTDYQEGFGIDITDDTISVDTDLITTKEEFNALKLLVEEMIVDTSDYQINYWDIDNVPATINSYPTLVSAGLDIKALRGRSVAFNQLQKISTQATFTDSDTGLTITNNNDGSITISGTILATKSSSIYITSPADLSTLNGKKYLTKLCNSSPYLTFRIAGQNNSSLNSNVESIMWQGTADRINTSNLYMAVIGGVGETINITIKPQTFDLSLMSLDNITSVLEFNRLFPEKYYGYNEGELLNSKASALDVVGYNAFDGELEIGDISSVTGEETTDRRFIRSVNFIKVIAGKSYSLEQFDFTFETSAQRKVVQFDANKKLIRALVNNNNVNQFANPYTITLDSNCHYVRIVYYNAGTEMPLNLVCNFHLTLTGAKIISNVYNKQIYALPNIDLRGVGTACDELKPDGKLIPRISSYTFTGNEVWNAGSGGYGWAIYNFVSLIGAKPNTNNTLKPNLLSTLYKTDTPNNITGQSVDKAISYNASGSLLVRDTSITSASDMASAMAGKTIYFELETPVETQTEYTFIDSIESLQDGATLSQTSSVGLGYVIDTEMAIYKPKGE